MSTTDESILVLGAGELGTFVLKSLAAHPLKGQVKVSVLLRPSTIETENADKRRQVDALRQLGVHLVPGDVEQEEESQLANKFRGFTTVIVCTGMYSPPGTQLKFAKAAIAANVQRYLPWQYGLDYDAIGRNSAQDLFTEQLAVRDVLRGQSQVSWIIISTGLFMSFLFEDFFGVVSHDRQIVRALGSWETRVTVTDASDIGRMVAEVVYDGRNIHHQIVYIAGDTISYGDLARLVEETTSRKVTKELWSVDKLEEDLSKDPDNGIKKYRIVFAQGTGTAWDKTKTLNNERGVPLLDVRGWLAKHSIKS